MIPKHFLQNESEEIRFIANIVEDGTRLSVQEAVLLYQLASPGLLGMLAFEIKKRLHGNEVFFIRNFHIEPTNHCIYNCRFCSFSFRQSRLGWKLSFDDILRIIHTVPDDVREIHITGGVHPDYDIDFYCRLFAAIKESNPNRFVKALTAIEVRFLCQQQSMGIKEGLMLLKDYGLDALAGGGAENFSPRLREILCPGKDTAEEWLEVHEIAHRCGISSNATMLYGALDTPEERMAHLEQLRQLQDKTRGFNAFIPLKFRNSNNEFQHVRETTLIDDIKTFAISRIFLDNIPHLKVYWPMLGKNFAQLMLHFGADDLDGTIDNSTKIYSMAGVEEQNPSMNVEQACQLISQAGFVPVERDAVYNKVLFY